MPFPYPILQPFHNLRGFLCWFDVEVQDGKSDEDSVKIYAITLPEQREAALREAKEVIQISSSPWDEIALAAWRYFPTTEEKKEWFMKIIKLLEEQNPPAPSTALKDVPKLERFLRCSFNKRLFDLQKTTENREFEKMRASPPKDAFELAAQGKLLLKLSLFPWQEIARISERHFEDENQARKWLKSLVQIFEDVKKSTV